MRKFVLLVGLFTLLGSSPTQATASFEGLGDLGSGSFSSIARGVSADGSVVVGNSTSGTGNEAFRWTDSGVMVGLGELAGGIFQSGARGVGVSLQLG